MINKRTLGQTGFEVSELALGSVKFGRTQGLKYPNKSRIPNDRELQELLSTAKGLGINLLDTAPAYGESESRIGKLLAKEINGWIVSTKVGEEFDGHQSHFDFSPEAIEASVYRSMKRLGKESLDIALIHSNGDDEGVLLRFGALEKLQDLKRQGVVRAVGVSYKTHLGAQIAISQKADVIMATLNLSDTSQENSINDAHKANIGVLIKKPFDSGHNASPSSLQFVLSHKEVSSAVIGTTSIEHLEHNTRWLKHS